MLMKGNFKKFPISKLSVVYGKLEARKPLEQIPQISLNYRNPVKAKFIPASLREDDLPISFGGIVTA